MPMELKDILLIRTFMSDKQLSYIHNELSDLYEIIYIPDEPVTHKVSVRVKIIIAHELSVEETKKYVNLVFVQIYGCGTDKVCTDYLSNHGINYRNSSVQELASSIGEYVLLQILLWERDILQLNQVAHDGTWSWRNRNQYVYRELKQLTVGIVGAGEIGVGVSNLLKKNGIKVVFINVGSRMKERDKELLKSVDYVTIHINLTADTVGCIGTDFFMLMRKDAVLINTARGNIINEQDLINSYCNGEIRGATLDVTINEPLLKTDRLRKCKGIIITPHISSRTEVALMGIVKEMVNNIHMEVWKHE